ncbi:MAG: hypothetical protein JNM12_15365 [Alphaproteobacteria bacterium]|nr:hypothetical protein [Alphaproteobacteria bacterium]
MIHFLKQSGSDHLVLFVHGFTGGTNTWRNENSVHFGELLLKNKEIEDKFDIAEFVYHTKFTDLSRGKSILERIFASSKRALAKNISIEEIARLLETQLKFKLNNYKNVVLIAHSMGGAYREIIGSKQ